jgi:PAS domain S-box-containing protein
MQNIMNAIINLPNYDMTELLYEGSRTLVYRGIREIDDYPVVIKLLRNQFPDFNELVQFRNQYAIAKNINVSSIVQMLALETYGNAYALIMEDLGGISLSEMLKQEGNLGTNVQTQISFCQIAIQIAEALDELYQNRVIHKDIKPANILIHPETKQVKLIDFSIASLLPRETQEIQNANALEGTLAYLSPEQTGRMNRGIDYRSDFYSLGITFYQLLTGELPFQSNEPMELVHCHLAKMPISVHQINPNIPLILSEIINKLMAKNAEDRYQSALGLKYDLEMCLTQLQEAGKVEVFKLGERDLSDRFLIPEKLYGREAEVKTLLEAFDRVSNGNTEMMLVAGFSGIGKTAVVNEVHKPIARQRGYFIKGKYDQFQRNIPFFAFVQAFRDLMGQLLSESDVQLENWKMKILKAVGDNGQVLIDVIPELELVIGKQPPATELSGTATQNRFNLLIQKFVKVFTNQTHPLVMFIDDLQWADSASLNLLKLLMQDTQYLLILGAYRDNEVSSTHPFMLMVDEISKSGAIVKTITLQPLSLIDMNRLVADTLACELYLAQPLTELVCQKTKGNPFFATQFLKALYEEQQITFDWEMRRWACDITEIKAKALTDDVVEFMARQLQKLPSETQDVLKLAACIGAQFDLNTLAIVSKKSPEKVASDLWKALQEGLIIPNTEVYKFFMQSDNMSVSNNGANPIYRFLHDRVQQASYSLISEEQKPQVHYTIGQLLIQNTSDVEQDEKLFDIVNHLNKGELQLADALELLRLAKLNLLAGQKAKLSTAYQAGVLYLSKGIQLLPIDSWETDYQLTFSLHKECIECHYLAGQFDTAETLMEATLNHSQSVLDRATINAIQLVQYQNKGIYDQAIAIGLKSLAMLGLELSASPDQQSIKLAAEKAERNLGERAIADLAFLPAMADAEQQMRVLLLINMIPPTYIANQDLMVLVILEMTNLCLQYGNTPLSGFVYLWYGTVLCAVFAEYEKGDQFGALGLDLNEQANIFAIKGKAYMTFGSFVSHWRRPFSEGLDWIKRSFAPAMEAGELSWCFHGSSFNFWKKFLLCERIEDLAEEYSQQVEFAQKYEPPAALALAIQYQVLANLQGKTQAGFSLNDEKFDEALALQVFTDTQYLFGMSTYYFAKSLIHFYSGDYATAYKLGLEAEKTHSSLYSQFQPILHDFYQALNLTHLYETAKETLQYDYLEKLQIYSQRFKLLTDNCPENYLVFFVLLEAEIARIQKSYAKALDYYDRAIAIAKENQSLSEEALANELIAKFYLDWGKQKIAQLYMTEAYYCYARWGANAKVVDLETRYFQLLQPILQQPQSGLNVLETLASFHSPSTKPSSSSSSNSDTLDFAAVIQAAQALSSTIQLDDLLKQLTQIILQNAGADKCVLVLPQDGIWQVRAIATPRITELCSEPLEDNPNLPIKLIQYVKRTQTVVVIDNLETDLPVIDDYLIARQPKSLLCLPILNQGHLAGILYLKNRATAGVFNRDRLTVINFLCTQAAISLENAQLYQQSQQTLAELEVSDARFQTLADNLPGAIFQLRLDADGSDSVLYVSSGCVDIYEVSQEDFLNGVRSFREMEYPDDQPHILQSIISATENLTPFEEEFRIVTASGKVKWIQVSCQPTKQADGAILWDGVALDISDRKQAEVQLCDSEAKFRSIIENAQDIIFMLSPEGNLSYLSPSWQDTLGYDPNESTNQPFALFVHPDDLHLCMDVFIRLLDGADQIASPEYRVLHSDGTYRWFTAYISSIKDADGRMLHACGVCRDNTDRKQAESIVLKKSEELEQTLTELQNTQLQMVQGEKMASLGNLVAGVAHEINNPIGFLNGSINNAKEYVQDILGHLALYQQHHANTAAPVLENAEEIDLEFLSEDLPKLLDSMKGATDRIKGISTSLRTFSRADTEYQVKANLHEGINSTILILKYRLKANEKRPAIQVVQNYGDLPEIECFPGQLNQVFMNILANAIDVFEEAAQNLSFKDIQAKPQKITIATEIIGDQVKIAIADNGKGMSEEVQQKIFDHLFTTKAVGKGTGLGLAIAQQIIVEKHGGTIEVNSIVGQGTEFVISIPTKGNI